MIRLAWRNLVQDKMRLTVTMMGIVFAVALIVSLALTPVLRR